MRKLKLFIIFGIKKPFCLQIFLETQNPNYGKTSHGDSLMNVPSNSILAGSLALLLTPTKDLLVCDSLPEPRSTISQSVQNSCWTELFASFFADGFDFELNEWIVFLLKVVSCCELSNFIRAF